MIAIYHNRGKGCGQGPVHYLLGQEMDREDSELLRGDPENTIDLINSLEFEKKYTSGLLSFTETDLDDETKSKIMDEFERTTFAGLEPDQYDILWVEHTDKNNLELNFVIPNVELSTGKRYQPYYDRVDRKGIESFKEIQNQTYGLTDPRDPARRESTIREKGLPSNTRELKEALDNYLCESIENGSVSDRTDVMSKLEGLDLKITRITDKALSIEHPETGRPVRLRGELYEKDSRFDETYERGFEERERAFKSGAKDRLEKAEQYHDKYVGRRSQRNSESYKRPQQRDIQENEKTISIDNSRSISSGLDAVSCELVHGSKDSVSVERSAGTGREHEEMGIRNESGRGSSISDTSQRDESRDRDHVHSGQQDSIEDNKGLDNDGNGKTFNDYLRGFSERAKAGARSLKEGFTRLRERFREGREGVPGNEKREPSYPGKTRDFGQQIGQLDRAIKQEKIRSYEHNIEQGGLSW